MSPDPFVCFQLSRFCFGSQMFPSPFLRLVFVSSLPAGRKPSLSRHSVHNLILFIYTDQYLSLLPCSTTSPSITLEEISTFFPGHASSFSGNICSTFNPIMFSLQLHSLFVFDPCKPGPVCPSVCLTGGDGACLQTGD